jgi:hypothetical protein
VRLQGDASALDERMGEIMADNPKHAWLKIQMDLETYKTAITGAVPDVNIELALAIILQRYVEARWTERQTGKSSAVLPAHFVPPFKARPD